MASLYQREITCVSTGCLVFVVIAFAVSFVFLGRISRRRRKIRAETKGKTPWRVIAFRGSCAYCMEIWDWQVGRRIRTERLEDARTLHSDPTNFTDAAAQQNLGKV